MQINQLISAQSITIVTDNFIYKGKISKVIKKNTYIKSKLISNNYLFDI